MRYRLLRLSLALVRLLAGRMTRVIETLEVRAERRLLDDVTRLSRRPRAW